MINPLQTQAELSAAYIRAAGFAWANQLKIMQLFADAMIEAPFAPVRGIHRMAAMPVKPRAVTKPVKRNATVGDAGEVVVKASKSAKAAPAAVIEPTPVAKAAPKPKSKAASKPKTATVPEVASAAKPTKTKPVKKAAAPKVSSKAASKPALKPALTADAQAAETPKPARRKTRAPSKPPAMPAATSKD